MLPSSPPRPELFPSRDLRAALDAVGKLVDTDARASFGRRGRDFSEREAALFDQVRQVLGRLFRRTRRLERTRQAWHAPVDPAEPPALSAALPLTCREHEVLRWAAAGKTDRDIADILSISHRTVHKHLQRVYRKLGVETRTAAVMRAIAHA